MSNRTYICADCRTSRRAEATSGLETPLRCAGCGGGLWEMSPNWKVPKKPDDRAWTQLRATVQARRPIKQEWVREEGRELLRRIDWQIGVVTALEDSARRETTLKELQCERAEVLQRCFGTTAGKDAS